MATTATAPATSVEERGLLTARAEVAVVVVIWRQRQL
jgi:hypothetical protein